GFRPVSDTRRSARSDIHRQRSPVAGLYSCSCHPGPNAITVGPASNCSRATVPRGDASIARRTVSRAGPAAGRVSSIRAKKPGATVKAAGTAPSTLIAAGAVEKLRPPMAMADAPPGERRTHASSGNRALDCATPADSGVNAQPSPTYHRGGSSAYQSISFGRTPLINTGYGSDQRYRLGSP